MRFERLPRVCGWLLAVTVLLMTSAALLAQETTGGLQGTVKDATGAVVARAHVEIKGTNLVGSKSLDTDSSGYYRFANLPPGTYTISVSAQGFKTVKRGDVTLEVGHLPTLDLTLDVGTAAEVVEVTGAAPLIDTTTETTLTNVTSDVIKDIPHGYSFQSVIQFAPGARNEPLAGGMVGPNAAGGSGTGGQSAGSGTNGQAFGYSIGGGADSENAYLVEGQETADAIGGFSHTNVPFAFIQELQVKSTGIDAEYGGALGGVVNVVMQKGGNRYHGSVFSQFETANWDGSPNSYPRYDPSYTAGTLQGGALADPSYQVYQPKKDTLTDLFPGFTFGGPFIKDKLWFFASFNPEFRDRERVVNWAWPGNAAFASQNGPTPFSGNQETYYTNARIDYAASQKIRIFGSWLYQFQRQSGEFLPAQDSAFAGLTNPTATSPPEIYGHNLGFAAPNVTTNAGLDYTITPHLVGTFRWGYNFQNYHDFGMPTGGAFDLFDASGAGATDNLGNPIPAGSPLSQISGFLSAPNNQNNTAHNVVHRNQIDADVAWFKSGWWGTHNFKFGYQLMRLSNSVLQHFNEPNVTVLPGAGNYVPNYGGDYGTNCATADPGGVYNQQSGVFSGGIYGGCAGQYGYIFVEDYGSGGTATSMNHAFFAQDAWTIGHGITINAGIRLEHEYLPAEDQPQGGISTPIKFGWGDKLAPRIGAAWDVLNNGKWKLFGSYGRFFDIMKLNLAISSFGGQYWNNCYYALGTQDLSSIVPAFSSNTRYCGGAGAGATTPANFPNGTPAGLTFIEDANFRTFPTTCSTCTQTEEGVAPGLKPYEQHEVVLGMDHQIGKNLAFEARWDRRRLDHAIEDAALFSSALASETFVIVNPGQGVDHTFDGFYNFLYGQSSGCASLSQGCPPSLPVAVRNYDGVEFRLTKAASSHWAGMFSYTYSRFSGNYTGLTNTDISDGGGGRNAPNNSRAFDEPFFYYGANGKVSNGLLPTDRPNVFKGYAYYELPWWHNKLTTNVGIFQYAYQGSPVSSFVDVGISFAPDYGAYNVPNAEGGAFPTYILPRGQFLPISQDSTGNLTIGNPYYRRTPWFTQSDLQFQQGYKITESKALTFSVTVPNALNQRAVTAYGENVDTDYYDQFLTPSSPDCGGPCTLLNGPAFYKAAMSGYNYVSLLKNIGNFGSVGSNGQMTLNSLYGKPLYHQLSRNMYMAIKFTF
ncbi:MAG TPA: carboxypeptidase regulatory-like domain-containing protein [Candidatus Acidoferrum sp.]|jgi:outer membrane receptor protein involved in Fe transport|nr:carboxypeptidase regulatory-like domain-containing protein [Candidatus Acidoferrum sp.]